MRRLITDIEGLFINETPLIDTRAPVEFCKGSFPQATNLPLMTDDERAAVGTCYKREGQAAATALGHQLVSGQAKRERVSAWARFAAQHPEGAIFCFRGGQRSAISQQWLSERGLNYPRVAGGYKAMRRWLLDSLATICANHPFIVIGGKTGSAKTRLINEGNHGAPLPRRIDLEGIANHRGSAFGRRLGGQPSQINFENSVAINLVKLTKNTDRPIISEDESRLIGRCALPPPLQGALKSAPLVIVETTLAERVEHSFENYILANLRELESAQTDAAAAFEMFASGLRDALDRIRRRLGGERHQSLCKRLDTALERHRQGDSDGHREWIEPLLRDYYDPMYTYQLKHRKDNIIFSGRPAAVIEFLSALSDADSGRS